MDFLDSLDRERYVNDETYRAEWGSEYLRKAAYNDPQRLILGSNGRTFPGWTMSDLPYFDATESSSWWRYYRPDTIDEILAEHVLEHIEGDDLHELIRLAYCFLKPHGVFTISVPDGNHPDERYIEAVKPGGTGPSAKEHKHLFSLDTLRDALELEDFRVVPIEYWHNTWEPRSSRRLHIADDFPNRALLSRCANRDLRGRKGRDVNYTSLIVQAFKE